MGSKGLIALCRKLAFVYFLYILHGSRKKKKRRKKKVSLLLFGVSFGVAVVKTENGSTADFCGMNSDQCQNLP